MSIIKKLLTIIVFVVVSVGVFAADVQAVNPDHNNVVAYYESGIHAIPLSPVIWLEGFDLVKANGNGGNFNQWYWNSDYGYHSVWNVAKNGKCNNGVFMVEPHPEWGDYLVPGADYCVTTNQYLL